MPTLFSLNINKIALLRNSRGTGYPSLEQFAGHVLGQGVKGLTLHPRHDERHIKYTDLNPIKQLTERQADIEMNVEGYPDARFIDAMVALQPDQITLVPDASDQLTSDHGWNFSAHTELLQRAITALQPSGSRICLFIDPNVASVNASVALGVGGIELYTEPYARAHERNASVDILKTYHQAASLAHKQGLRVNAGHDLNLDNLAALLSVCPIDEVSIGHAAIVESIYLGLDAVIKRYLQICA